MRDTSIRLVATAASLLWLTSALIGCTPGSDPAVGDVRVTEITTGRTLAPDGTIVPDTQTNMFWTTDTFYVSVATEGSAPRATIEARWTYQDGTVAAQDAKTISPNGPTVTALEASSPTEDRRWKPGDYKVEVRLNQISAGVKELNAR